MVSLGDLNSYNEDIMRNSMRICVHTTMAARTFVGVIKWSRLALSLNELAVMLFKCHGVVCTQTDANPPRKVREPLLP